MLLYFEFNLNNGENFSYEAAANPKFSQTICLWVSQYMIIRKGLKGYHLSLETF